MRKRRISGLCTFQGSDAGFSVFCCYSICFHKNSKAGETAGSRIRLRGREAVHWEDETASPCSCSAPSLIPFYPFLMMS